MLHVWLGNPRHTFFTCDARYLFDFVCTFPRDRLGAARARQDPGTGRTVANATISVASHSSQPFKRKGTHKYRRSTASGNDFPDADLAPLTLLGGTTARAQVDAADTAFVMATHDATLVSMPAVIAVVGPTSIGYGDGDPSSRPALAAASNVSVGSCDASWCPGLLFCK